MRMYSYVENNRHFIVIAENLSEAYNELYKKGLIPKIGSVAEINSTVIMIHSPEWGITRVNELRNVNR